MNFKNRLLILLNKNRLNKLITKKAPYDKIVKQSQKLDKYIYREMLFINQ